MTRSLLLPVLFSLALGAFACSKAPSPGPVAPATVGEGTDVEAATGPADSAPTRDKAVTIAFLHTANVMGELEPCG